MRFIYKVLINCIVCSVFAFIRSTNTIGDDNGGELALHLTPPFSHLELSNDNCPFSTSQPCSDLKPECITCSFNYSCVYGSKVNTSCEVAKNETICNGDRKFFKEHTCAFCYQLPIENYNCSKITNCQLYSRHKAVCTVNDDVICLGNRRFSKYVRCEYQSGYRWFTALFLSVTVGGFGVDRFYLGNWQEGIGKLFSFGGLGIWTLIDVILIATGYLKPSDGSIYQ